MALRVEHPAKVGNRTSNLACEIGLETTAGRLHKLDNDRRGESGYLSGVEQPFNSRNLLVRNGQKRDVRFVGEQRCQLRCVVREELLIVGDKFVPMIEEDVVILECVEPAWGRNLVSSEPRCKVPIGSFVDRQRLAPTFIN
jgi:hypothetical protein